MCHTSLLLLVLQAPGGSGEGVAFESPPLPPWSALAKKIRQFPFSVKVKNCSLSKRPSCTAATQRLFPFVSPSSVEAVGTAERGMLPIRHTGSFVVPMSGGEYVFNVSGWMLIDHNPLQFGANHPFQSFIYSDDFSIQLWSPTHRDTPLCNSHRNASHLFDNDNKLHFSFAIPHEERLLGDWEFLITDYGGEYLGDIVQWHIDFFIDPAPPTKPPPPLVAVVSDKQLQVSWQPAEANGAVVDRYFLQMQGEKCVQVEGGTLGNSLVFVGLAFEHFQTNLLPGASYMFKVQAENVAGTSAWSDFGVNSTFFALPQAPSAPTLVHATDASLQVQWSAPFEPTNNLTHYILLLNGTVLRNGSLQGVTNLQVINGSGQCANVTELLPNQTYHLAVQAFNHLGASTVGRWAPMQTLAGLPSGPTWLSFCNITDVSMTVFWDSSDPRGDIGGLLSYHLEIGVHKGGEFHFTNIYCGTQNNFTVEGLTAETEYCFRVKSMNRVGHSTWSPTFTNRTQAGLGIKVYLFESWDIFSLMRSMRGTQGPISATGPNMGANGNGSVPNLMNSSTSFTGDPFLPLVGPSDPQALHEMRMFIEEVAAKSGMQLGRGTQGAPVLLLPVVMTQPGYVCAMEVLMELDHPERNDVEVMLWSPKLGGVVLNSHEGGMGKNNQYLFGPWFMGTPLKGTWYISLSDKSQSQGDLTHYRIKVYAASKPVEISDYKVQQRVTLADPQDIGSGKKWKGSFQVSEKGFITELSVKIEISPFPYNGDVRIILRSPSGSQFELKTFADNEANSPLKTVGVTSNDFNFQQVQGTWQIEVGDFFRGYKGFLNAYDVTISTRPSMPKCMPMVHDMRGGGSLFKQQIEDVVVYGDEKARHTLEGDKEALEGARIQS